MEFVISSSLLLQQLSAVGGVIMKNPVIPILENFLFDIRNDMLIITASDLQTSINVTLPIISEGEESIAVPARILMDTLKSLPEQQLTFSINKNAYNISIKSNNGYYKLSGENADDFPHVASIVDGIPVEMDSETLKKAIHYTLFATSNDELRPAMGGVYKNFSDAGATFVATDGHRLVRYIRSDINVATQSPFIVPRKTMTLLNSLLPNKAQKVRVVFDKTKICFNIGNIQMIARLIDERYPDYENVIPTDYSNKLIAHRLILLNSLKRTAIYANRTTHQVKLQISANKLSLCAEDLDFSNEAHEEVACQYEGENMTIGFNARLLIEMLNIIHSEEIEILFVSSNKAVLILPRTKEESENLLLLIMPLIF